MKMRLIRSAWIYGVPLPTAATDTMRQQVEEHLFQDPASSQAASMGFALNLSTKEFITDFDGGWSLTVRIDEKVLPPAAVTKAVNEKIAEIEEREERRIYRKEKLAIKDDVVASMLSRAFIKTKIVPVFYYAKTQLLVIACGTASDAESIVSLMREAFGSLKAVPFQIDNLCAVLTSGLCKYIEDGDTDLGPFALGDYLQLQNDMSEDRLAFKSGNDDISLDAVVDALQSGYRVTSLSLHGPSVSFKLSPQFAFKQVVFDDAVADDQETEDPAQLWIHEATVQVMLLCHQVELLLELSGSLFPVPEEKQS